MTPEASLVLEIVKQVPSLAVLVCVVWMFLGKMNVIIEAFRELHKEHIDARTLTREAIRDNIKVISHLIDAIDNQKR